MWYRIVSACPCQSGPATRSVDDAWATWEGRNRLWQDLVRGAIDRSSARLASGTTRRAVEAADISAERGRVGRGVWELDVAV